jgi:5'-nucleotidase
MASFQPEQLASGARAVSELIGRLLAHPLPPDTILNVNVPDLPWDSIHGYQATRLGHRHQAEGVVETVDPRGRTGYWVGPAGPEQDAGPGTDFFAVREGFVSVTPIQVDLTRYDALDGLAGWLRESGH